MILKKNNAVVILLLIFILSLGSDNYPVFSQISESKSVQEINSLTRESYSNTEERISFQSFPQNFEYNSIRCIQKDHKGYMWFGTEDGLIRFDGVTIYVYEHHPVDSTSLRHNSINALLVDSIGRLWIGTTRGLNLYNPAEDNFINVGSLNENLNRLNFNYISALSSDNSLRVWVGTYGDGVRIYDPEKQAIDYFTHDINDPQSIGSNRITCIAVAKDNKVWLGTPTGLNLFSEKNMVFRQFYNEDDNPLSLSNNNITSLAFDLDENLWIGTRGGGLNKLSIQHGAFIFKRITKGSQSGSLSNNFILSLFTDFSGSLWIGTENGGLNHLGRSADHFDVFQVEEGNNYGINSNSIWSLFGDNEGRIWIGTASRGINVIDKKFNKFESYQKNTSAKNSLPDNNVAAFTEDNQGNVWIAMDGGGICKFNPATHQFSHKISNTDKKTYLANNAVQAILFDANENLWIGTWAGGVDRLDRNGKRIRNYRLENELGAGNNNIVGLYTDSKANIWVATAGSGLFRYDALKDQFNQILCDKHAAVLNPSSFITCLLEDSEGTYWVGTLNGLLTSDLKNNSCNNSEVVIGGEKVGFISSNMIYVLFEDSKGRIWVGTGDNGLNLFNKPDSTSLTFRKEDGLPSNKIYGILEDDMGFLWIITNKGVSRFNHETSGFTNYTREDGLNSNELKMRSYLRTKKGQFYLGGENGFNVFYPENIKKNKFIPPVYFTNFKINNATAEIGAKDSPLTKQIAETSEITLNHKQSSFTIEFVALNYTRPKKNQFTYKLEGFNTEWISAGNNTSASYTNIKPGKYVFMVKGSNNDGIWNPTPTQLQIKLKPPLWKTWWAYIVYVLLIMLVTVVSLRIWHERINIKNELRLEKLAKEREHELNEQNIQFFTNISHEFRTPLSLITGPLDSLINITQSKVKEQLLVIQRNAGRLLQLTNNLLDLRKLEEGVIKLKIQYSDFLTCINEITNYFSLRLERRQINLIIESDENSVQGWFDPEKLETIVLNLLANAITHTPDNGTIRIKIAKYDSNEALSRYSSKYADPAQVQFRFLEVTVIDYGTGISPEELPFIFEKFYQANSGGIKKKSGTGVGLTLTKGLVEMHHGRIWAESMPGKETHFTFILPIDRTAYAGDEIVNESTNLLETEVIPNEFEPARQDKEVFIDAYESKEKSEVLIVEDNDELRAYLSKELEKSFKVTTAEDGEDGINKALNDIPDLIVSDIVMPRSSGIDLCKTIKTDIRTCHIPMILLTAKTTVRDQIEGTKIGADAYLIKPFNIELLLAKINQLIQSRRKLYAQFSQDVYLMPNKITDNQMDQGFINKVIDYIVLNIADESLNVEGLAVELNLSRSNVYRKIKALTGKTIVEFIRNVRLKQAIKLMETKKYSLAEIAYQTGFTSPSYFTKCFKNQYGKPPSDYLNKS